jgi:transcriptional regulator with XRE-family HTH domain
MTPEQFRTARKALGLTQAQLASEFHCATEHVNRMENGKLPIQRLHVIAIWALENGFRDYAD